MASHPDALLASITAAARVVFDAAACSIAVLNDSGDMLEFRAASGVGSAEMLGVQIPSSKGIAGYAVMSGETLSVADVSSDSRFARDTAAQTGYVPQSILAGPLIHDGEALGVIEVLDARGDPRLELLGLFADMAALALVSATAPGGTARTPAEAELLRAAVEYARTQSQ